MQVRSKRPALSARLAVFIVGHLAVLALLALSWALATLVSRSYTELSPQGGHLRLVPVQTGK